MKATTPVTPPAPAAPVIYKTAIDYDFYLANQFLNGMKATVFAPNVMRCSAKLQSFGDSVNATVLNYQHAPTNSTPNTYVFNLTKVISTSGSSAVGECYTTGFNIYNNGLMK